MRYIYLIFDTDKSQGIVTGVMGVVFVAINLVFTAVLLFLVIFSSSYAIFVKNPDTRYQPMRDDRGSFIKSQTQLNVNTELDALGATARGPMVQTTYKPHDLDDDEDSYSSGSGRPQHDQPVPGGVPLRPSTPQSNRSGTLPWQVGAGYDH